MRTLVAVGAIGGSLALLVVFAMTRPLPSLVDGAGREQPVAVFHVRSVQVPRQWMGYGIVRAVDSADVPARVAGVVVEVNPEVREGSVIPAGTLLVKLDDQDALRAQQAAEQQLASIDAQLQSLAVEESALRDRVRLAQEEVTLAQADEQRVRDALKLGAAAPREVDRARQTVIGIERAFIVLREAMDQVLPRRAALQAQDAVQQTLRDTARTTVQRCRVVSPVAGVVQRFDPEVGENITAGQVVARVVDTSRLEVPVRLPSSARGFVAIGDPVRLDTVGQVPRTVIASVSRIEPEDSAAERTMVVHVDIPKRAGSLGLAPGEFVEAAVDAVDPVQHSVVPRRSVRSERVMAVQDGRLVGVPVVVSHSYTGALEGSGVDDREWIVLGEQLPDGLVISVDGGRSIVPGARVRAIEPGAPPAAGPAEPAATEAAAPSAAESTEAGAGTR